jgi:hypothetical protein
MTTIMQGWNFMRSFRLVLGLAILVQGIVAKDTVTILLGIFLGGLAIANAGCQGNCALNPRSGGASSRARTELPENKN